MEESKDEEGWSDASDDSDESEDDGKHKKKDKKLNPKGHTMGKSKKQQE